MPQGGRQERASGGRGAGCDSCKSHGTKINHTRVPTAGYTIITSNTMNVSYFAGFADGKVARATNKARKKGAQLDESSARWPQLHC